MECYEKLHTEMVTNGRDRLEIVLLKTPNNRHLVQITQTDETNKAVHNVVKIGARNLQGIIDALQNCLESIEKPENEQKANDLVEKENSIIKQYLEDMVPIGELAIRFSMKESEIVDMFKFRNISMAPAIYKPPYWKRRRRRK